MRYAAPGADDAFKAIGTAFAVLSDADKRAFYDNYGDDFRRYSCFRWLFVIVSSNGCHGRYVFHATACRPTCPSNAESCPTSSF